MGTLVERRRSRGARVSEKGTEVDSLFYETFDIYSLILADAGDSAARTRRIEER